MILLASFLAGLELCAWYCGWLYGEEESRTER